jgi:hypothetical protein
MIRHPLSVLLLVALLPWPLTLWAGQPDPSAMGPELAWLQAASFPAWVVAVIWVGQRLIRQMQLFTDKLDRHVTQTERRLARLEALVFMGRAPARPGGHFAAPDADAP